MKFSSKICIYLILTLAAFLPLSASPITWKNLDGSRSFKASYLSNDGERVILSRKGRILTIEIAKLHPLNQAWLKKNHPPSDLPGNDSPPPEGAAFDTLEFGDSREEVMAKLNRSRFVEGEVVEALLARTGMDGIYRTTHKIGGLQCSLFFEWTRGGYLREVSLRTKGLEKKEYDRALHSNWKEWIQLLTQLHGRPRQDGEYPHIDELDDGLVLGSHLWHTQNGHSVILGTGQDGRRYSVVVRITSEYIKPAAF